MTAEKLMIATSVFRGSDSLEKVISFFETTSVHVAPIVDLDNKLIGILTKTDIYQFLSKPGHYLSCPIEWIMTRSVISANPNTTVNEIVTLLRRHSFFSLPVVSDNVFVGLVTIETVIDYLISLNT